MFLFPIIYIFFFLYSLIGLTKDRQKGILLFIIFGLSIYTISLSITHMYGFTKWVPYMQSFKEVSIVIYLSYLIVTAKQKIRFHLVDKLVLLLFLYAFIYVLIPLGSYGFFQRVLAFKSLCFFPVIYFTGRMMNIKKVNLAEIFHYIGLLSILAATVLFFEVITNMHLQTYTGYAAYNSYFFDIEPSGNYGLSWTYEIESGMKRFESFFANPLEYAAATLISVSALAALATNNRNKLRLNNFTLLALFSTLFGITFALSRASFASYLVIIYAYAWIMENKRFIKLFHYGLLLLLAIFLFITIKGDLFQFIINTIQFKNESSLGHVIEWLNGLDSMIRYPLGIGLGESGRISAFTGLNTGGENQFVILGVQVGIVALAIYLTIYYQLLKIAFINSRKQKGKLRRISIFIFLIKMGLLLPLFTAEVESYIYISYLVWFLSGILINMVSANEPAASKNSVATLAIQ